VIELRTFWRRVGGFTAVLLAFALMFAPAAEAAFCSNEAPAAVAHQFSDAGATSDDHGKTAPDVGEDLGLCQHGHCHHATPYLPSLVAALADHATVSTPTMKLQNQHPRSRAASRLERPPRV
jgi:hypothetical protein